MFRSLRASLMAIVLPGVAAALLITALAWTSYSTLDQTARKTFVAKDVVADILPPPMYLIEMRLLLSQGLEQTLTPNETIQAFNKLEKDYDARAVYWTQNPPHGLETKLLGTQHTEAKKFMAQARSEIINRLVKGDVAGARAAMPGVHAAYLVHRSGVDDTVASATQFAEVSARQFDVTGERGPWILVGVAALLLGALGVMSLIALRRIVASVQHGVAMARTIAAGDLSATPVPTADDELGQLQTAMLRMQDVLRNLIQAQTTMAREHTDAGRLSAAIELDQFEGSYRTMAAGVNDMVASHVALNARIVDLVGQYGQGEFGTTMEDLPGDKARVTTALRSVQDSLKASAQRAAQNLRIRGALDAAAANVMLADAGDTILYVNPSLARLLGAVESDLRAAVPGFSAAQVIGSSASALIACPEHPPTLLAQLTATHRSTFKRGTRTFELSLTPILDKTNARAGTAMEWTDITADLAAREAEQRAIAADLRTAAENLRIKNALDVAEANVMIADSSGTVIYVNQSLAQLFAAVEADVRADVAGFAAGSVIGSPVGALIASPAHPHDLLKNLRSSQKSTLRRGPRTFTLSLTPIVDIRGERAGTALEWKDISAELAAREREQRSAAETLRIKNALDKCSTNVMIADADNTIIYMNESVAEMMSRNEGELRKVLPQFDARRLINASIDTFHKNPHHQQNMLANLRGPFKTQIKVGSLTFGLIANPIVDQGGQRVGTVVEWADRSAEVLVEQELAQIVDAAAAGDFARRVVLEGKDAFFRQVGHGINRLLDTTSAGLGDIVRVLGALATGNLTQRISADYDGTFGTMKNDANVTVEQLAAIIGEIRQASETIHTGAIEIASGNLNLSERTEQQASSLQQTAATLEELTATVKQNAESARQANELAATASAVALKGGGVVNEVVTTMNSITDSSKKIVDIISVIDGIAFQTNILALNAAVEAARAGEQGRGFAVVAGEVRNLAQRSASAAKEIKTLIGTSVDKVDAGSRLVAAAGQTMQDIVASVKRVTDIMGEISAASLQQSSGIEQVNQAVSLMDQATQQNAALVEQAAAAAESMKDQAGSLARSVGQFTLAN